MRHYTVLHIPLMSFFSKPLYRDVAATWRGTCLAYLLLLLAVCWVPTVLVARARFSRYVSNELMPVAEQLPPIEIRDGVATIEGPQPIIIKNPKTGLPATILDTTGQITSLDGTSAHMLLTRTRLFTRTSADETRTTELSGIGTLRVDREIAVKWLGRATKWFLFVTYPLGLLLSYLYRVVQAFLYAAIGLAFAGFVRVRLPYQTLLRLAIVAVTPVILLDTVLDVAGVSVPYWWLICFVLTMAYLFFGVKAASERQTAGLATSPDVPSFSAQ